MKFGASKSRAEKASVSRAKSPGRNGNPTKDAVRKLIPLTILVTGPFLAAFASNEPVEGSWQWPHLPYVFTDPLPEHRAENRSFVCSFGITAAPNGRLWASWESGGGGESMYNFILLATSGDGGRTWSEPVLYIDPPFRASYSGLWTDPDGTMWFTFSLWPLRTTALDRKTMQESFGEVDAWWAYLREHQGRASELWAMTTRNPGDPSPEWESPRLIAKAYNHMNTPTVLADGTWVWPTGTLTRWPVHGEGLKGRERLMAWLSDDDGETWFGGLMIEERSCSYPDATQGPDGTIYVIYDHERHGAKEILVAAFTEEDVAAGKPVSGEARFRQVVDKAFAPKPWAEDKWEVRTQAEIDAGGGDRTGDAPWRPARAAC